MENKSKQLVKKTSAHYAREHFDRVVNERRRLRLVESFHHNPRMGYRLAGFARPNQHTRRHLRETFGEYRYDVVLEGLKLAAWFHGKFCVPHPIYPESVELAAWISYDLAAKITCRSKRTLYRWRYDPGSTDPSAWRLLEWAVHCVSKLPDDLLTRP